MDHVGWCHVNDSLLTMTLAKSVDQTKTCPEFSEDIKLAPSFEYTHGSIAGTYSSTLESFRKWDELPFQLNLPPEIKRMLIEIAVQDLKELGCTWVDLGKLYCAKMWTAVDSSPGRLAKKVFGVKSKFELLQVLGEGTIARLAFESKSIPLSSLVDKKERQTFEKINNKEVRTFVTSPFESLVVGKWLFEPFQISLMMNRSKYNFYRVGQKYNDGHFHSMFEELDDFENKIEVDCRRWDRTFSPEMARLVLEVLIHLVPEKHREEWRQHAERYVKYGYEHVYVLLPNGQVVVMHNGQPSGCATTTIFNTIAHYLIWVLDAVIEKYSTKQMYVRCVGDDNLTAHFKPYTVDDIKRIYARCGFMAKDTTKCQTKIDQLTFLAFTYHEKDKRITFDRNRLLCSYQFRKFPTNEMKRSSFISTLVNFAYLVPWDEEAFNFFAYCHAKYTKYFIDNHYKFVNIAYPSITHVREWWCGARETPNFIWRLEDIKFISLWV